MLVFQIALGVVIGGLVLMWVQRRREQREKREEAFRIGQEAAISIVEAVRGQAQHSLALFKERLLDILRQRMERWADMQVYDTLEEQQEMNRKEITELREVAKEAEQLVWKDLERHQAESLELGEKFEVTQKGQVRANLEELVRQEITSWRAQLTTEATQIIYDARQRAKAKEREESGASDLDTTQ